MEGKISKKLLFVDNIISRLAFALVVSVLISVLLAQVITSLGSSSVYTAREPIAFINSPQ